MTPEQTVTMIKVMDEVGVNVICDIEKFDDRVELSLNDDCKVKIWSTGTQTWSQCDMLHRVDGPAWIRADGTQTWWLNGKWLSEAEHARLTGRISQ